MRHSPTTLSQLRREVEAIERKYARVFAAAILKPVTNQITELWAIAVAKEQPKPDALSCVRKVVAAGFRLHTFTALHIYLKDCRKYGDFPNHEEIVARLFPPKQKVELSLILPGRF